MPVPEYWPPKKEREAERRRLDAIRPWHTAAFVVLVVALVSAVTMQITGFWAWFWNDLIRQ